MSEAPPSVSLAGIRKVFAGGTVACAGIDLDIRPGEVLALLGENGAGKSTLMNILSGLIRPTAGEIRVDGRPVNLRSPNDALALGIGMVHQHFLLVPPSTVAENVALGHEPDRFVLRRGRLAAQVRDLSQSFGLDLDPGVRVGTLPVGLQQRVEIVKALYGGARVLILDEPTSVLTPAESALLFQVIRTMVAGGRSVVFISHKLREVKEVAHRIVVLRQGAIVGQPSPRESEATLASLMVGRPVLFRVHRTPPNLGDERLRVNRAQAVGVPGLKDVDFAIRAGEIFGVAGVDGNGQTELEEVLSGLRALSSGTVFLGGTRIDGLSPRRIRELGVGHIPSDRPRWGLIAGATVADNLALASYYRAPYSSGPVIRPRSIRSRARELTQAYDIRVSSADQTAGTLSGGNQQKVVVAREVSRELRLLVAAQPTRGLDVGATEFMHSELMRLRSAGVAVLLISADLDEVLNLADRVGVLFEGRLVGICGPEDRRRIGLWMAGATETAVEAVP
ncbi:MAG: ABC transporter ATP-binding protein [Candidatus Dormibacteraceae bacterium]